MLLKLLKCHELGLKVTDETLDYIYSMLDDKFSLETDLSQIVRFLKYMGIFLECVSTRSKVDHLIQALALLRTMISTSFPISPSHISIETPSYIQYVGAVKALLRSLMYSKDCDLAELILLHMSKDDDHQFMQSALQTFSYLGMSSDMHEFLSLAEHLFRLVI
jgi:hypothetical protein